MSTILLFVQHDNAGKLLKGSLVALSAAKELQKVWGKAGISALCLGPSSAAAAKEAAQYGFTKVLFSESALFSKYRAEPYARAIALAAKELSADTLVAAATSTGKDVMPRVTAMLDGAQASEVVAVNSDGTLKRPMYAGNMLADVELVSGVKVITVRGTAFPAATSSSSGSEVKELALSSDPELVENPRFGEVTGYDVSKADRPELSDAAVVVSGGRALASAENFEKVVFPLADALGAGVGASRAAVDSGYAPNDWQVGQTGKIVAPNLYIAVGISGAIQHLAGMKDSKVIVAINKDPDAPIYEVADYGLVADLFTAVPEMTAAIKKIKSA